MAYNPLAFGLMLTSAGVFMLAAYFYKNYIAKPEGSLEKPFGSIFVIIGLIAGIFGLYLYITEPIPTQYIEVYAVGYLVFSILLTAGGLCMLFDWDKRPASYLAAVSSVFLFHSAYVIFVNAMSKSPFLSALLFASSGLAAASSVYVTHVKDLRDKKHLMYLGLLMLFCIALLAMLTGIEAQSGHVAAALAA